jgi:hypothetical protein
VVPPAVIEPSPAFWVRDQLKPLFVPLADAPEILIGESPVQEFIGDVVDTAGVSSHVTTMSSETGTPAQPPVPVTVNLIVRLPLAEVGSNLQSVGAAPPFWKATTFPVPDPLPNSVQVNVDGVEADELLNGILALPHWFTSGPAFAEGPADQSMTITSDVFGHPPVPFTFKVIVTWPAAEVGVMVGESVPVLVTVAVPELTTYVQLFREPEPVMVASVIV